MLLFNVFIVSGMSFQMIIVMQANVNIRAIAQGCSEYNITVVVKREDCIRALKAVHSRFYLSRTTIAMGIVGPGLIGGTLLDQLRDQVLFILFISTLVNATISTQGMIFQFGYETLPLVLIIGYETLYCYHHIIGSIICLIKDLVSFEMVWFVS